jgi:hypothetical protein
MISMSPTWKGQVALKELGTKGAMHMDKKDLIDIALTLSFYNLVNQS